MTRTAAGTAFALARLGGARARLLPPDGLRALLAADEAPARRDALQGTLWEGAAEAGTLADADAAVADTAAREARHALRDLGPGPRRLAEAFLLPDDARALRGALRAQGGGAADGPPMLEPTPRLDRARLREIAACPDGGAAAARLEAWGSPLAPALRESGPDLRKPGARAAAEVALDRTAARALGRAARGAGADRAALRALTSARADLAAAAEVLALSAGGAPPAAPVEAGERLSRDGALLACRLPPDALPGALAAALRDLLGEPTRAAELLARPGLADHLLGAALVRYARRLARAAPLSVAVPCAWLVEVAEQARRVRLALAATAGTFPAAALVDLLEA
jgi:hypothetical protein